MSPSACLTHIYCVYAMVIGKNTAASIYCFFYANLVIAHLQGCFKCVFTVSSERNSPPCIWSLGWIVPASLPVASSEFVVHYWESLTVYCRKLWQEILLYFPMSTDMAPFCQFHLKIKTLTSTSWPKQTDRWYLYVGHTVAKQKRSAAVARSLLLLWFRFVGSVTFVFVPSVVKVLCWSWQKARMRQMSDGLFRGEFSCRRGNAKLVSLCVAISSCNYSVSCGKIFHVFLSSVKPCGSLDHLRWTTETWTTFYKQQ